MNGLVSYEFLEDAEIHQLVFSANSRAASDDYVVLAGEALDRWIRDGNESRPFRLLIDIAQSGLFPLSYTIEQSSKVTKSYPIVPPRFIAYITNDPMDAHLLTELNKASGGDWQNTRRIFKSAEIDTAKNWLCQCAATV